jgi:protein-tyrosine phosphatase
MEGIDWIDEKVAISGVIENYGGLEEEGITTVINVMAEQHDDVRALSKRGIAYFWIPVVDGQQPRTHQIATFLHILKMNNKEKMLIHCELGRGRSAFFGVCYLIDKYELSLFDAIDRLKKLRPIISLTPSQRKQLGRLYG